jgi:hypothetical protein
MTRGNRLHPLAPIVAAVALAIGSSTATVAVAGPRDGKSQAEVETPEDRDGTSVAPTLDAGETTVAQEEPPTLEFGSAASGEASAPGPVGTVEQIKPIIEAPSQEQIDAVQEPLATESLPIDQVGERDSDEDMVPDAIDNCTFVYNIDQSDDDGDGIGNACGQATEEAAAEVAPPEPDTDGDGVPDYGDNCWQLANPTQKDGDGDGLGNGCDEGSAPFLTPDEDEVVEAQRFVQDPTLIAGDPGAPEADGAPQAPGDGTSEPVEVIEGETVAAPAERDQDRERSRDEGDQMPTEDSGTATEAPRDSAGAPENADRAEGDRQSGGDEGRDRGNDREGTESAPGAPGPSRVEQGERPRRNPALTEESGPVLPPPRSSKRYPLESGFETVIRIDAGALGSGEADERRGAPGERGSDGEGRPPGESDKEKDTDPAKDGAGIGRSNEGDREERDDVSRARPGDGDASSGPVPIEAGVVIESPPADDGDGARDEPGDERRERETEAALTNVVGWQADPEQTDRADSEPKEEDGNRNEKEATGSSRDRGDKGRDDRARPEWDRDRHYKGGEATKRAGVEAIAGTSEDDLYLTQRSGKGDDPASFVYPIPVGGDGLFRVRLHFAETSVGADGGIKGKSGERVFDVEAEGEKALEEFDIYDEVGSMTAVVKMFDIEVDDGTLELEFVGRKGQPVVSAIEVLRHSSEVEDAARAKANWMSWGLGRFNP